MKADPISSHRWVYFLPSKAYSIVLFHQSELAQWDRQSLMEVDTELAPQIYTPESHNSFSSVYKLSYTPTHYLQLINKIQSQSIIEIWTYILPWISNNGDAGDIWYIILLLELIPSLMKPVTFVLYYIGTTNFLLARASVPAYLELLLWHITVYPLTLSFLNDIEWQWLLWGFACV